MKSTLTSADLQLKGTRKIKTGQWRANRESSVSTSEERGKRRKKEGLLTFYPWVISQMTLTLLSQEKNLSYKTMKILLPP